MLMPKQPARLAEAGLDFYARNVGTPPDLVRQDHQHPHLAGPHRLRGTPDRRDSAAFVEGERAVAARYAAARNRLLGPRLEHHVEGTLGRPSDLTEAALLQNLGKLRLASLRAEKQVGQLRALEGDSPSIVADEEHGFGNKPSR